MNNCALICSAAVIAESCAAASDVALLPFAIAACVAICACWMDALRSCPRAVSAFCAARLAM